MSPAAMAGWSSWRHCLWLPSSTPLMSPRRPHASAPTTRAGSSLELYLDEIGRYPLLTREEEQALGRRIRENPDDEEAIALLVRSNLRFGVTLASKFVRPGSDQLIDLIQVASIGLGVAAREFDPSLGKFITYAAYSMADHMRKEIAAMSFSRRLPPGKLTKLGKVSKFVTAFDEKRRRQPTDQEISESLDLTLDTVAAMRAMLTPDVDMDGPPRGEDDSTMVRHGVITGDTPDPLASTVAAEERAACEAAFSLLHARDARVLRLYYGFDGGSGLTLEEIGDVLGVTRERARQLRDRALRNVRLAVAQGALKDLAGDRVLPEAAAAKPKKRRRRAVKPKPARATKPERVRKLKPVRAPKSGPQLALSLVAAKRSQNSVAVPVAGGVASPSRYVSSRCKSAVSHSPQYDLHLA